jgi:ankyrin repeat protein
LEDFYGGIDKRIGIVSLDFLEQMRKEHCDFVGCNFEFTSNNYNITTCPEKEWRLITEGLGADGCKTTTSRTNATVPRRFPAFWWDDCSNPRIMYSDVFDAKERSQLVIAHLCELFGLLKEEVIAIILFTGPMYTVYNGILSNYPADIAHAFRPINFTTTIHAIISAIQKLSRQSPVQHIVYRGTSGRGYLPSSFWETPQDGLNVYGYTEFGVMSMTSSKEAALQYSGLFRDFPHPAVLAFAAGAVDRGARVQPLSQFPFEVEFTFPPMSYIQPEFVDGKHRVEYLEHPDRPGVQVPVIYVRVNANIRSPTFDELNEARKQSHIAAFRSQNRDTAADIRKLCDERKSDLLRRLCTNVFSESLLSELQKSPLSVHSVHPVEIAFEMFQSGIAQECESVLLLHEQLGQSAFLDRCEHSRLVIEMISVRKWAVAKLLWFIEDEALAFENILNYPLAKSYREYVSFCRNRIRQEVDNDQKRSRALLLCELIGLVSSQQDLTHNADEKTPIVVAVENGACSEDIELLLDAGYPVDSVTPDGNSLLSTAVRYGYVQTAELLINRSADVNFLNIKDGIRTPMIFASVHGHIGCLQLLLDSGAEPSVLCLRYAKQHKNSKCVEALRLAGVNEIFFQGDANDGELWHGSAGVEPQPRALLCAPSTKVSGRCKEPPRTDILNAELLKAALDPISTMASLLRNACGEDKKSQILHYAIANGACVEVVDMLLKAHPDAAREKGHLQKTPLHVAFRTTVPSGVVQMLIDAYPAAAAEKDREGNLPLHYAIANGACVEVVDMLLKAHPDAAREKGHLQKTPLHVASGRKVFSANTPSRVVQMLIDAYPAAAAEKDREGNLPLHYAIENGARVEVVDMLLKAHPDAAREKNYLQEMPLHVASTNTPSRVVQMLIDAYPAAAAERDREGNLPLHYAIENGARVEVVDMLLKAHPDAARECEIYIEWQQDISEGRKRKRPPLRGRRSPSGLINC